MPVFTAIGTALGATTGAFTVGLGATALAATAVGVGAYALGGGFDAKDSVDNRIGAATGTGALTPEEARREATKRAYRSGVLHTSPTGLDKSSDTSTVKLK